MNGVLAHRHAQPPGGPNVVDEATQDELAEIFTDLDLDLSCEVVVLTGAGGTFRGGGDMDWLLAIHRDSGAELLMGIDPTCRIQKSLLELE